MNQTKLKAAFKQLLNMTIYEYVLQRRMEVAAQMLVESGAVGRRGRLPRGLRVSRQLQLRVQALLRTPAPRLEARVAARGQTPPRPYRRAQRHGLPDRSSVHCDHRSAKPHGRRLRTWASSSPSAVSIPAVAPRTTSCSSDAVTGSCWRLISRARERAARQGKRHSHGLCAAHFGCRP